MGKIYKLSELTPKWKKAGIYKINFPNGKCYIGLSIDIRTRIKNHINSSYNNNAPDYNYPVHAAIRKYGLIEEIEILDFIDPKD